jgi:predicted small metal-binding protein
MMQWNFMFVLACRETGLDCDFVIKGDTKEEFLRNGADHVINQHGIDAKEIYWDKIPGNFLCQSFSKVNT